MSPVVRALSCVALAALCAGCAGIVCPSLKCSQAPPKLPQPDQPVTDAGSVGRRRPEAAEAEQRRLELQQEAWRSRPQWATARAMGVLVPYAFLCNDYKSVELAWRLHSAYYEAKLEDRLTKGQSVQYRGQVAEPQTEAIGCLKVPPGTRMSVKERSPFLVVEMKLGGRTRVGITSPGMVEFDEPPPSAFHR